MQHPFETPHDVLVRSSADAHRVSLGPLGVTILLEMGDGLPFSVALFEAPPGATAPPQLHANTREDWCALICEGEMTIGTLHGERRGSRGVVMVVRRGVPFNWRNAGPGPLRFFAIYAPAGFENFFPDAAVAVERAGGMPSDPVQLGRLLMPLWRQYEISHVDLTGQVSQLPRMPGETASSTRSHGQIAQGQDEA
jgi:mannose-6-phosphate isomerase-like protein (cupin superfamily)